MNALRLRVAPIQVECLALIAERIASLPLLLADSVATYARRVVQELKDYLGLSALQDQVRKDVGQIVAKPLRLELEKEEALAEAVSPNRATVISDPRQHGIEKKSATLTDTNERPKRVRALPFPVVLASIPADADLPFPIKEARKVADLQFREHEFFSNGVRRNSVHHLRGGCK